MSLGTTDEGGMWVSDVIYVHDEDLNIYWMSNPATRHSKAIPGKVAASITVSGRGEDNVGLQLEGLAEKIEGNRYDLAVKHYEKRSKGLQGEDEDVLDGDSWYVLRPKRIDIIYEPQFGFEKKTIIL